MSRGASTTVGEAGSEVERVAALIVRHQEGDPHAMPELVSLVTPLLRRVAFACRLGRQSADDVVQSTLLVMLLHLRELRDPACGLAWISVVARREAVRQSRDDRRAGPVDALAGVEAPDAGDDPERILHERIATAVLRRNLARLPARQRDLLQLLFLGEDDLDYAEVAARLGIPVGSIGPTRQRGLRRVRELLSEDPGWEFAGAACA